MIQTPQVVEIAQPLFDPILESNGWYDFGLPMLSIMSLILSLVFLSAFAGDLKKVTAVFLSVGVLLGVSGLTVTILHANKVNASEVRAEDNVRNVVSIKYGVTVHENVTERPRDSNKYDVNRGLISASNAKGERIQISIELAEEGTDVLAFSSGAEMPKVNNVNNEDKK